MKNENIEGNFAILQNLNKNTNFSQRNLARELDLSLGKLYYCIKALNYKGLVKIRRFKKSPKNFKNIS